MAATLKGYKLICTAADKIPREKIALLEAYGAEVIICPTDVAADDPRSYYKVAERIRDEQGAYLPYQYYNQANPRRTTAPPARRSGARPTAGSPTGSPASAPAARSAASAKYLKEQNPEIRVIGVDTVGSVYATTRSTASCRRRTRSTST